MKTISLSRMDTTRRILHGRSRERGRILHPEETFNKLRDNMLLLLFALYCCLSISTIVNQPLYILLGEGPYTIDRMIEINTQSSEKVQWQQPQQSHQRSDNTMHKVNYLTWKKDISTPRDYFSASWLQPIENFMEIKPDTIQTVEDGVFKSLGPLEKVRMTKDWLDFSVEHLSHWWKTINIFHEDHSIVFNATIDKFDNYINNNYHQHKSTQKGDTSQSPLHPTIAIIAFMPYENKRNPELSTILSVHSLAACIASLQRVNIGRVLVVGKQQQDQVIVEEAFRLVRKAYDNQNQHHHISTNRIGESKIGDTEVQFVLSSSNPRTKYIQFNMPKVAIQGLQDALLGTSSRFSDQRRRQWLGESYDPSYWKYVYLTEPDTILQARTHSLLQMKEDILDQGMVLSPHRLQPIPHEIDIPKVASSIEASVYLPSNFSSIHTLDANSREDACCDDGDIHPGPDIHAQRKDDCDKKFWFQCEFNRGIQNVAPSPTRVGQFDRLEPYSLVRFSQGTGIVNLAATNHGRRCIPTHKSNC